MNCHYVKGLDGARVLIPGCWGGLMDGREYCTCPRGKMTMERLEDRVEALEKQIREMQQKLSQ